MWAFHSRSEKPQWIQKSATAWQRLDKWMNTGVWACTLGETLLGCAWPSTPSPCRFRVYTGFSLPHWPRAWSELCSVWCLWRHLIYFWLCQNLQPYWKFLGALQPLWRPCASLWYLVLPSRNSRQVRQPLAILLKFSGETSFSQRSWVFLERCVLPICPKRVTFGWFLSFFWWCFP